MNIVDALKKVKNDLLNFIIDNLNNKSDVTHTHDEYATDEYVNEELSKKADSSHIHEEYLEASDVEDLATEEYVIKKIAEASLAESNVDLSCYYTKTETDKAIDAAVEAIEPPTVDLTPYAETEYVESLMKKTVKYGDVLLTTNHFSNKKFYISKIDNMLYAADKRWEASFTVYNAEDDSIVATRDVSKLFDGSYEDEPLDNNCFFETNQYAVLRLNYGTDYPAHLSYGDYYLSFYYYYHPQSVTARGYCNYAPHGIGWHDLPVEDIINTTYRRVVHIRNDYNNLSEIEITITAPDADGSKVAVTTLELCIDRTSSATNPMISKYGPELLYYPLTAPSFIGDLDGTAANADALGGKQASEYAVVEHEHEQYLTSVPDIHAKYFTITDDGIVSLKPEYRGASVRTEYTYSISDLGSGSAGSKNAELPEYLIIPEIVNRKAVASLADGMFLRNDAVKNVTLPVTISKIPERCFDNAHNLLNVYNTENIKAIGKCAFQRTSVERLNCPNLEQLEDISTFQNNGNLIYVNVGKVNALPDKTFNNCHGLNMVRSSNEINSVGNQCFSQTPNLKHAGFISDLTNIGEAAFMTSGVDFDWSTLENCTFGTDATPLQYNPTDFWSACVAVPCENELPTLLSQNDPRWVDRQIGASDVSYVDGCFLMCLLHAYCGLHDLSLETVMEFEEIANNIDMNLLDTYTMNAGDYKLFAERFGLTVEEYSTIDQTALQAVYDALANGKYAVFALCGQTLSLKHVVLAYGVTDDGELLIADSSGLIHNDQDLAFTYHLPYKNLTSANYKDIPKLWILSL